MSIARSVLAVAVGLSLSGLSMARGDATTPEARQSIAAELRTIGTDAAPASFAPVQSKLAGTHAGTRLEQALKESDPAKRAGALKQIADDLAFEPTSEAPTPEGWPAFTPIGEIELKTYPTHRIAVVDPESKLPEGMMFWRLFLHIQKNDIAMTAPVEMNMSGENAQRVESMGFLYQSDKIGQTGMEGNVRVVDVPEKRAISVGLRGEMNKSAIADASTRIDQWLTAHADQYEASGELRVLGYNSPSMPSEKKFYEVQRLVTARESKK